MGAPQTFPQQSVGPVGDTDILRRAEGVFDRLTGQGTQGLNLLTALDALLQQQQARSDPTLPALLNTQLDRLVSLAGGGGFDLNSALGGSFAPPTSPISFGAGDGSPFDLPIQFPSPPSEGSRLQTALGGPEGLLNDIGAFLEDPFRVSGRDRQDFINPPPPSGAQAPTQAPAPSPTQSPTQAPAPDPLGALSGIGSVPGFSAPPLIDLRTPSLVGSFADGTNFVPRTGLAQVHQGEAIVPANQNPGNIVTRDAPENRAPAPNRDTFQPTPPQFAPPPGAGAPNPLETSIGIQQQLAQSGGPITPEIQQIQQQQALTQQNQLLEDTLRGTREDFGARGLGLSGVEANAELQGRLARNRNLLGANQNIALNAANQNFGGQLQAAGQLGQTSLGSGQLGLQNAQFQQASQNALLDQIQQLLSQSFATPEQFAASGPAQVSLV